MYFLIEKERDYNELEDEKWLVKLMFLITSQATSTSSTYSCKARARQRKTLEGEEHVHVSVDGDDRGV